MEDQVTQDYYACKSIQEFLFKCWVVILYIGIYDDDYIYSTKKDRQDKINDIRDSADSKKALIFDCMKKYYLDLHLINIADFGSGYGGTSHLYKKLENENKNLHDRLF